MTPRGCFNEIALLFCIELVMVKGLAFFIIGLVKCSKSLKSDQPKAAMTINLCRNQLMKLVYMYGMCISSVLSFLHHDTDQSC